MYCLESTAHENSEQELSAGTELIKLIQWTQQE